MEADPARPPTTSQEVAPYLSTQTVNPPMGRPTRAIAPTDPSAGKASPAAPAQVKKRQGQGRPDGRPDPPVPARGAAPRPRPLPAVRAPARLRERARRAARDRLNPIYPTVLAELEKYGDPLSTGSLNYLHSLQPRYDFVVVDCQDSHKWGGTDYDWTNPTHVNRANMRRMLRYIVTHADGALN